jgi:dTDP-4-amino-4,6-dideoxygalactose transaminase
LLLDRRSRRLRSRGSVNFLERGKGLDFEPRRLFYLHHVAPGQWRGRHGHRQTQLVLVAVSGSCRTHLDDGIEKETVTLDDPAKGLHIAPWVWHELTDFAPARSSWRSPRLPMRKPTTCGLRSFPPRSGCAPMIPFLDMKSVYTELKPELDAAYARVMESGWFVLGKEVEAFEQEYAAFCGTRHCVGLGNGLEALELTLRAWGLGPGDEVIVPSNTYIATWLAVSAVGATVVPVEPTSAARTSIPDRIAAAITPRTRAIMPVHLYGEPADMDAIMALADKRGLKVVEDVAQAQGAKVRGRRTGSLGHAGAHSFLPDQEHRRVRRWGCGNDRRCNGGRATARNAQLRQQGEVREYRARLQLATRRIAGCFPAGEGSRRLDEWNDRRRVVAARYADRLADVAGLGLPRPPQWAEPVWHLYVVRTERRAELIEALAKDGIGSLVHLSHPAASAAGLRRSWPAQRVISACGSSCRYRAQPTHGAARSLGSVDEIAAAVRRYMLRSGAE